MTAVFVVLCVCVCMYVCSSYGHLTLCKVNVCGGCCKDFPERRDVLIYIVYCNWSLWPKSATEY